MNKKVEESPSLEKILSLKRIINFTPEQENLLLLIFDWDKIAGSIASKTKPFYLQNDVLTIACSSTVLSQELSFRSLSLINRIEEVSGIKVKKIISSTANWEYKNTDSLLEGGDEMKSHPDYSGVKKGRIKFKNSKDAKQNLLEWKRVIQERTKEWVECPCCEAKTPHQEIGRWGMCFCCWSVKNTK